MKKIKILLKLIRLGIKSDASFTVDFLFGIMSSIFWIGIPIIFFKFLFLNIETFDGWHYDQILTLVGIYTIIDGLMMGLLIRSMGMLESDILDGRLDQFLIKPFDTQLFYLFRSVNFIQLINVVFGLAILIWSLTLQQKAPQLIEMLLSLTSILFGCMIYYSIWFLIVMTTFWWPSTVSRSELFLGVVGMSRYPSTIFTGSVKFFLTYVIPLLVIANPAARVLTGKSYGSQLTTQLLVGCSLLMVCRFLWQKGLKRYEGAGR